MTRKMYNLILQEMRSCVRLPAFIANCAQRIIYNEPEDELIN